MTDHGPTCWEHHPSCALTAARQLPVSLMQRAAFLEAEHTHFEQRGGCEEAGHIELCAWGTDCDDLGEAS